MASADMRLGNNSRQEHAYILPLSAKSKKSLEKYRQEFIKFLAAMDNNVTLEDIAYTLQQKREIFDYRLAITAKTKEEAISKLNSSKNEIIYNNIDNNKQLKTVFMFPGQGSQYANMCIDLYKNNSFFKDIVDNCVVLVNRQINIDFARILYPDIHGIINEDINQTRWAQMVLFIISYSLTKLLNNLNIYADSYIGHSIGEYVAAVLSGVFSLEDAIKIVLYRGKVMQTMQPGVMLSIQASYEEIGNYARENNCEIAVINALDNCVAAGTKEDIGQLK